jgi:hypothetical protein
MCRGTRKKLLLVFVAVSLFRPVVFAQATAKDAKAQKGTTELRIQVTGGEQATPVKGATVYLEWKEGDEKKRKEGATNRRGIAGPYRLPRGKVFIQVTTEGDEWERKGGEFDLKEPDITIPMNLTKHAPSDRSARLN